MSPPAPLDIDVKADSDTTTVVVPDPLTVTGVAAWRLQAAKVPTGTAAAASSDMFKSPVRCHVMSPRRLGAIAVN